MCGIAGIFNFNSQPVPDHLLKKMGEAIMHRGPDDSGIWSNDFIGLCHQRLSIIDTSQGGHQPMSSLDGRYTIVFNGEIYNHHEFRAELQHKGFRFHSGSDTEVLLYLYMAYGETMLNRLNGMFAFVIWDNERKELFVCRDRMGVKPLYYHLNNSAFFFASEPKAIFAAGIQKEINHRHVNEWLTYRYVAGSHTLLNGIQKLLPGHWARIKANGNIQFSRWYHLGNEIKKHPVIPDPQKWFEETFNSSVRFRMVSDVPVGVLLSGGLDSNSIAASLRENNYRNINTFNIAFKDPTHDESNIARDFSKQLAFPFHSIFVENHVLAQTLTQSIYHLDEPLIHMNDPHILAISSYAKQHVKVLLSGEGADEIMGGYVRHKTFRYTGAFRLIQLLLKLTPDAYKNTRIKKLERYLHSGNQDQLILSNASNYFKPDFTAIALDYLEIPNTYRTDILYEAKTIYPGNAMRQLLYLDQHTYLQSLNERNDRATMAGSIECREPFQDYRLVEGLGTLDLKWLTRGKKGKYILKQTMQKHLPDYILNHEKIGLSVPWIEHLRSNEELHQLWNEFSQNPSFDNDTLNQIRIKPIISQMNKGEKNLYEGLMLQLFMFHIWKKNYIEKQ